MNYQSNPMVLSNKISKADKYLPGHIVKQLYDVIDNVRDKFYLMWHVETGVRVSDIVGLKRSKNKERQIGQEIQNVDWDLNRIHTYDHKKDVWRYVYFPQHVRSMLKIWLKERQNMEIKGRALFPFSEKTCNRIIKKWCNQIGFKHADKVGSHWCRHTFIRLSRKVGRDLKAVQQNTGDSVKTILEWYSDLSAEDMISELESKPMIT